MADVDALLQVLAQIEAAKPELDAYAPAGFQWYDRSVHAAKILVPFLVQEGPGLQAYVAAVLNSPSLLRDAWAGVRSQIEPVEEVMRIDTLMKLESVLLGFVAGDTVSVVVTGYLLEKFPNHDLASNSKSDYPDIFVKSFDYAGLPIRSRSQKEIGAAVRGESRYPVRVTDGLEIKTSRNGASIDCHYPHVGLHAMICFDTTRDRVVVTDVLVAFLRKENYRIASRKTEATTVKASFNRSAFVSVLPLEG